MPERRMNPICLLLNLVSWLPFPVDNTKVTMNSIMIMDRTAVATVESTSCNPIFAKMDTRAAKKADSKARRNHSILDHPTIMCPCLL